MASLYVSRISAASGFDIRCQREKFPGASLLWHSSQNFKRALPRRGGRGFARNASALKSA